jgi:hypothetical protein
MKILICVFCGEEIKDGERRCEVGPSLAHVNCFGAVSGGTYMVYPNGGEGYKKLIEREGREQNES